MWCTQPSKIADPGDVLISVRAPVGPTNIADQRCAIGRGLAAIRPAGEISSKFLLYALRHQEAELAQQGSGSTFEAINRATSMESKLRCPPLAEQRRIVAQVEALLARTTATRERLAKVPAILKRFRQAVLAAACDGRLTDDGRASRSDDGVSGDVFGRALQSCRLMGVSEALPFLPRHPADVPSTWSMTELGQLLAFVTSGSRGWARYYSPRGAIFIRSQDINTDRLVLEGVAHVTPPASAEAQRTRVKVGDVLITITGANVTKTATVETELGEAYVSQHVALLRLVEPDLRHYLHIWLLSTEHGRGQLQDAAYGAGKPGLNLDNIRQVAVMPPPLEEQREIVRRVEALFALADKIEQRVAAAALRAEKLSQAILAKAFRGELVPTEAELARREGRDYEPAAELLERIRAKRSAGGSARRRGRRGALRGT